MATFIQGVTDTNLDPVLFTPDYSFLRYNLQKKTSQYEQGLKSVSSAYGALKKELSDPVNEERRNNYLKAAESELQKIASADLSLQQNVNAANAIFDPIATDPAIAFDAYHTGRIKRELSEMESWADSDDMVTRKKFNSDIYNWLKRDLESLKTGSGNVNNYKVQGRKAWAYVDPQDLINQAAKEQGFVIKNDETGNPYIVTQEGGPANREAYEKFASSVLRSNPLYQKQRSILGEARVESDLEYVMSLPESANLTKEDAYKKLVSKKYTEGRQNEKEYITGLTEKLSVKTAEYNAFLNKNAAAIQANPQGQEAQAAIQMAANLKEYKSNVDQANGDYVNKYGSDDASFESKKQTFTENFMRDPKSYYAQQYDIENAIMFSNIRSSFGVRTIKPDQAFLGVLTAHNRSLNTLNNIADDNFDNALNVEKLELERAKFANKLQGKDQAGNRTKNADGTDKQSSVEYIGNSAVQVNTVQKINQLKEKLEVNKANAVAALTSTYGGLYLLERMGTKPQDVALIRGWISRQAQDPNAKASKEEQDAIKNSFTTMFTWAKSNEAANPELLKQMRAAQGQRADSIDFIGMLRLGSKNYVTKDANDYQAVVSLANYDNYNQETKRISGLLEKSVDSVVNKIKDDSSFSNLMVEENGKKRLIQADDLVKRIPLTGWKEDIDWAIDPAVKLSEEDKRNIAEGIFDGRVKVDVNGYLKSGGRTGQDAGYRYITTINYQGRKLYIETPGTFTPSTDELNNKLKKINERIPIPVLDAEVPGAVVTGSSGFIIRNNEKEDIRVKLSTPTQENANIMMSDGSGTPAGFTDVPAENQEEIRKAMASKENVEQMIVWTNSPLNSGSQVVEVTMKGATTKDAPFWAGQRFYFPINVSKTKNEVFSVFAQADELDEFMAFSKRNEPYKVDYFEGSGVKAEVIADSPGAKTGRVMLYSKFDPATRKYVDNWITKEVSFDLNKLTFAEMKQEIFNNFITPYMQGYMNYNKQAMNSTGAPGSSLLQQLKNVVPQ